MYHKRSRSIFRISSRCLAGHAEQRRAPQGFVLWAGPSLGARLIKYVVGIWGRTPTVLYQNACIITICCTFFPCRIDEIGTRDEWMVGGIVDGLFVFCIFYSHMNVVSRKMCLGFFRWCSL